MKPLPRATVILSLIAGLGASLASLLTLTFRDSFPGTAQGSSALAEARGWSLVTLALVVPLLCTSLLAARHGSLRARLSILGTLFYLFYSYLEFAVSPPFSALYLLYVLTFASAGSGLLSGLAHVDLSPRMADVIDRLPRRSVAAFALTVACLLSLAWLKDIVTRSWAQEFGFRTGDLAIAQVVQALDLGVQVPLLIASALLLLRRHPSSVVAAGVMLVNSVCMGLALFAMVVFANQQRGQSVLTAFPFAILPLLASALSWRFFGALSGIYTREQPVRSSLAQRLL